MNDREKAIRILEGNYKNFVLRHNGELLTVNELIALLKAQQPRLMTLEEILDRGDDEPPFLEYNLSTISVLKPAIFQPDNSDEGGDGYMRVVSACCASGFYNRKEYGKVWRCWTSRPTDEQMEATPWNT